MNKKINSQHKLKDSYEEQMHEKVQKIKVEKAIDQKFVKLQSIENDRLNQRRMLDFMKIYNRKAVKNNSQLRIKTEEPEHNHHNNFNPESIHNKGEEELPAIGNNTPKPYNQLT